jgi:hypothetical protein
MKSTNTIEQEVDAIRDKLYEETKNMTVDERTAFFNDGARELAKTYGFKVVSSAVREPLIAGRR